VNRAPAGRSRPRARARPLFHVAVIRIVADVPCLARPIVQHPGASKGKIVPHSWPGRSKLLTRWGVGPSNACARPSGFRNTTRRGPRPVARQTILRSPPASTGSLPRGKAHTRPRRLGIGTPESRPSFVLVPTLRVVGRMQASCAARPAWDARFDPPNPRQTTAPTTANDLRTPHTPPFGLASIPGSRLALSRRSGEQIG
jgi:hypothetical protein